ncbi:hypothetical protein AB0N73_02830 [Microbacterium sp. NPDC089189]|uniref:hypothetical protein n=1 Tax=Microbacterium sp. NPDC089189 TaxID=3154972 RepID=UPI003448ED1B
MHASVEKAIADALRDDPRTTVVYTNAVTTDSYYVARRAGGTLVYVNPVHRVDVEDGDRGG